MNDVKERLKTWENYEKFLIILKDHKEGKYVTLLLRIVFITNIHH